MEMPMSFLKATAYAVAGLAALTTLASARDQVQVTGSSTVLPYAIIVAESFGDNFSFPSPVVSGGGTGVGIKTFCDGVGENTADIATASRPIKASELARCKANGVTDVAEVRIGYDGIVFASRISGPEFNFTPAQWYNAVAAEVVIDGKIVANPYTKWSDVDPKLPDQEILAFIPGTKHGTREVFDVKVIEEGCKTFKADKVLSRRAGGDKDKTKAACIAMRKDGRVVEIDGDYSETLARLGSNKNGIGVFGLAFYENNRNSLRVATFKGVTPSRESVASGQYKISRPLFLYVKMQHVGVIPGLKEFVTYFVSSEMAGPGGPLEAYGLVPDPKLSATQKKVAGLTAK
jgi:phosphate transport system substrate-binding protein